MNTYTTLSCLSRHFQKCRIVQNLIKKCSCFESLNSKYFDLFSMKSSFIRVYMSHDAKLLTPSIHLNNILVYNVDNYKSVLRSN